MPLPPEPAQRALHLVGGVAVAPLLPACQRKKGLRQGGWGNYTTLGNKLRKLGVQGKPWIFIAHGFVEVCCREHNPNDFDDKRKFRVVDEPGLLSYDADCRLRGRR
jgi:hypothetical protein